VTGAGLVVLDFGVSPTTIRSRILKEQHPARNRDQASVSPTTIRSRILKVKLIIIRIKATICFTHNDPFEDTERANQAAALRITTKVSPTTIRSRILKGMCGRPDVGENTRFTHNDPFEDTER